MYLKRRKYLGLEYEHRRKGESKIIINGEELSDINSLSELTFSVGYWRKANAIHNFFVEEVQGGEDDCEEYYVPEDKLQKLKQYCEEDLGYLHTLIKQSNKDDDYYTYPTADAEKLNLYPVEGFFFGSQDIDMWFEDTLKHTIDIVQKAIQSGDDIYYSSSW